jgi:hypothetical protein
MKRILRNGLFIIWIMILAGCTQKAAPPVLQEMVFEVDPERIEQKFSCDSLSLSFHPPAGWKRIPDELFRQFKTQATLSKSPVPITVIPIAVFLNPESKGMLSLARIIPAADTTSISRLMDLIQENTGADGERRLNRARFLKDDIFIEQLLIQDSTQIVFKLLFQTHENKWIEMDYITAKSAYEKEVKSIESSLGTITITQ